MKINKGALLIIVVALITFLSGCQVLKTSTDPTESTVVQKDTSSEVSKYPDYNTKALLFDIYSEKTNIQEAVKEISLKHIEEIKSVRNKEYTEKGVKQRIDDVRMAEIPGYNDDISEYKNIVEGGNLYTYYLVYELKPRYPNEFSSEWTFETLQENGWILFDGVVLIIYHPNKIDAPYYLAQAVLFDEFLGGTTEQTLAEIVKNKIPQLKLLTVSSN